jgi:hypothetical protein
MLTKHNAGVHRSGWSQLAGTKGGSQVSTNFAEIVEEVKTLSIQEKHDLHQLIERYLIEARRDEMYDAYALSVRELDQGKLEFSSDTDELKAMLCLLT